jgi:Protein of unknown function (DUF2735)
MMNASLNQGSAKIYQFPIGGRAALAGHRYGATEAVSAFAAPSTNLADCFDSWYHQAAIQEAKTELEH